MKHEPRSALLSDINVTPFVDIMLVLLVVFMVAAPLLDQGITVALPRAVSSQGLADSGLVITLTKEHVVYVGQDVVTLKELRRRLTDAARGQSILIRADESAYVRRLVELWDLCRERGFREIHIATTTD